MKIVLDTNVLISALVFGGKPREVFELIIIDKKLIGLISELLMTELLGVLKIKFKYSDIQLDKIEKLIRNNLIIISPKKVPKIIKIDPFDNHILAIVDETALDFIISGDDHLLRLKKYKKVPIISPSEFIDRLFKK